MQWQDRRRRPVPWSGRRVSEEALRRIGQPKRLGRRAREAGRCCGPGAACAGHHVGRDAAAHQPSHAAAAAAWRRPHLRRPRRRGATAGRGADAARPGPQGGRRRARAGLLGYRALHARLFALDGRQSTQVPERSGTGRPGRRPGRPPVARRVGRERHGAPPTPASSSAPRHTARSARGASARITRSGRTSAARAPCAASHSPRRGPAVTMRVSSAVQNALILVAGDVATRDDDAEAGAEEIVDAAGGAVGSGRLELAAATRRLPRPGRAARPERARSSAGPCAASASRSGRSTGGAGRATPTSAGRRRSSASRPRSPSAPRGGRTGGVRPRRCRAAGRRPGRPGPGPASR